MSLDLSNYDSIACGVIVRIDVPEYRTTATGPYTNQVLKFSDTRYPVTITYNDQPETYVALGNLLGITSTKNELRNSSSEVTITITGIPNSSIAEIINSKFKGSRVEMFRVLFDPSTGEPLNIPGNPAGRFFGIVTNITLEETYDNTTRVSSNTISIICTSHLAWLTQRVQGRRTNPYDEEAFFPGDKSFSRVPSIINVTYNWGAPPPA